MTITALGWTLTQCFAEEGWKALYEYSKKMASKTIGGAVKVSFRVGLCVHVTQRFFLCLFDYFTSNTNGTLCS